MKKIIKEISTLDVDEKEKREFIRNFIARELGKEDRAQKIIFNALKEVTKGKRLVFSKK